ncbi:acyltransferase [Helicobacter bizzozeronii]|uniref:acyltransferase n=1 Tax=Helicobacter bizzozeronii TaxID=56877 RepID=UPI000CEECDF6|nr:acyltransferase [Helicobacter bizzozeronii]
MRLIENTPLKDVLADESVVVCQPCNLYGCHLKEHVFVGPFCEIQKGVVVGAHSRIQSHTFICSCVQIGAFCFIGHGVVFTNDLFKEGCPNPDPKSWKETRIGDHVSIGSNATILPVQICNHVVIGAGSVVTKDITTSGIYAGNPAKLLRLL